MKKNKNQPKSGIKNTKKTDAGALDGWKLYLPLFAIIIISLILYLPVLKNELLSWDDEGYILYNPLIRSFHLKDIFSQNVLGNYHPLTILMLSIEFHLWGLHETGYHAISLLFHLSNIVLVFYTIKLLSGNIRVALITALLFGIHPIHVESVAWAAELKDVLYSFFFLSAYILYLNYLKSLKITYYVFALLLFSFSLLSKAMAASLPVVFILTDYYMGRKINTKTLLEKAPFLLLALIFGVLAIFMQRSSGAISDIAIYTYPERIAFASYGFLSYLLKLIFPLNLCAFYPYPVKSGEEIPAIYYACIIPVLGLIIYTIYSVRHSKILLFGIAFFSVTVFLVLQLIPVGGALMADRYMYIPSIGIFYLIGEALLWLWRKNYKIPAIALISVFGIFFSAKTFSQCSVWKNNMSLYNDIISQYQTVALAYNNRGTVFHENKKYDQALDDFNKGIALNSNYAKSYMNRGNTYQDLNRTNEALQDYNKAIEIDPKLPSAYFNRGNCYRESNRFEDAIHDYTKAIELNPDYTSAYFNRGSLNVMLKNYPAALADLEKAIELEPSNYKTYYSMATMFYDSKKYDQAISSYTKTIALKKDCAKAYYYRGLAEYYSGNEDACCNDVKLANSYGFKTPEDAPKLHCN